MWEGYNVWRVLKLGDSRLSHYIGRHGLFSMLFGTMWICFGLLILLLDQPINRFAAEREPSRFGEIIEGHGVGWMWIACGIIGCLSAVFRRFHQPDIVGFNALLLPPLLWTIFYGWSFVSAILSGGEFGRYHAIAGVVVWLTVIITVLLTAGWPDPDKPTRGRRGQ